MMTPGDLLNKKFEKAKVGGYKAADVDNFLVEAASLFSQQNREMSDLRRRLESAQAKLTGYEQDQDSLREALLSAQKLADNIVRDARSKAELIRRDAEIKAENLIERSQAEVTARQDALVKIKREVSDFRSQLMGLYRAHIELINELPVFHEDEEPDPGQPKAETEAPAPAEEPSDPETAAEPAREQAAATRMEDAGPSGAGEPAAETAEKPAPPESSAPTEEKTPDADYAIKLNVRYNEETGEYVPLGSDADNTGRKR